MVELIKRVGIIGGNTLVGQHLAAIVSAKTLIIWDEFDRTDCDVSFNNNGNNNAENSNITHRYGMNELNEVISNSNLVFNLHEIQDYSICPDTKLLNERNVEFVQKLVDLCETNATKLVHLSTVYLQCSTRWPNICGREETDYSKFRNEVPFPDYCDSKYRAEQILKQAADRVPNVCARVGAVYGEGDRRSVICDAILLSQFFRVLPKVGDQSGTFQMTYAGNVAAALCACAEKLIAEQEICHEVVLISDDTPIKNIYESVLQPLCCSGDISCNESGPKSSLFELSENYFSFYLFFPFYWMFGLLAWVWVAFINRSSFFNMLPSPYYPYMVIHQWTFYSDFKLRIFFGHKPKFDFETSLVRSRDYYQQLEPAQINGFSWQPC